MLALSNEMGSLLTPTYLYDYAPPTVFQALIGFQLSTCCDTLKIPHPHCSKVPLNTVPLKHGDVKQRSWSKMLILIITYLSGWWLYFIHLSHNVDNPFFPWKI